MAKILIVDDEPLARERLLRLLAEIDAGHQLFEAGNGLQALDSVRQHKPDVLLLDIRMPAMDGLEVAHHLAAREEAPAIIFTTAYQDHALAAFDIHAVDYLLKPVRRERLAAALDRASVLLQATITDLRQQDPGAQPRSHFSACYKGELTLLPVNEVRYLRAEQKYVIAGWPAGELLLDESLVTLEQELAGDFIRIHRNALVAARYIDSLKKDTAGSYHIRLRGVDTEVQVSRRNLGELRKRLRRGLD